MKKSSLFVRGALQVAALVLAASGSAQATTVTEAGEAGQLTTTAQVLGSGVTQITGSFITDDRADLFKFYHPGGAFGATTVGTAGTVFDTQMFLFDSAGFGLIGNDDVPSTSRSALSLASLAAGYYFLGLSDFDQDPVDATNAEIFPDDFTGQVTAIGGRGALANWNLSFVNAGTYTIDLRTATGDPGTVPLPGTLPLAALALAAGAALRRRRA